MPDFHPAAEKSLERALGRRDLTLFAVNRVIGAGIFGLPAVLYAAVGPASAAAMALAAVLVAGITLCFSEVGSRFRDTGGPYLYAHEAFGPVVAFEVGWLLWVTQLGGFAAVTNLMVNYAGWFLPGITEPLWRGLAITVIVLKLTTINVLGVRRAAFVNNVLTVAKLVPLALFVAIGVFLLDGDLFSTPAAEPGGAAALAGAVFLAMYAYSGFETLGVPTGEVREPDRTIPFALLSGLAIVAAVYVGVQVVSVGTLPALGDSARPIADAAERHFGPFGAGFMAFGALLSTVGVAHAITLAAGRMPFAMAERGQLPASVAAVHPTWHTPWIGLVVSAAGMWLFTMLTTFTSALTVTVGLRVLIYLVTCASLPVFRRRAGAAPFRVPAGTAVAATCLVVCVVLLGLRPWAETAQLAAFVAVGLVLWVVVGRRARASGQSITR